MELKKIKSRTVLGVYIAIILGILVVITLAGTRFFARFDATRDKLYTLSPATKKILRGLDDVINFKIYFSSNLPSTFQQRIVEKVKDLISEYQAYAGKNLRVTWIDPLAPADSAKSKKLKEEARSMGIPEATVQAWDPDKQQMINATGYLGIAVLFGDQKEVIPVVQETSDLEYKLTTCIKRIFRSTLPKVGILKIDTLPEIPPQYMNRMPPQPERTSTKFAPLFEKLGENYNVVTVDISKGAPIDTSIKALVIPGSASFSDREIFEIDQYFMKGGNLVAFANAMNIDLQRGGYGWPANPVDSKLLDLLQFYGVKVEQNIVQDAVCSQIPFPQRINTPFGEMTAEVPVVYPYFVNVVADGMNQKAPAVSQLSRILMPWPNTLSLLVDIVNSGKMKDNAPAPAAASTQTGVKATILLQSSAKSWVATGATDVTPQQETRLPASGMKRYTLAASLTGSFKSYFAGKSVPPVNRAGDTLNKIQMNDDAGRTVISSNVQGKLVVVANSDFARSEFNQNRNSDPNGPQNMALVMNLVDGVSPGDNLISIRTRVKSQAINADMIRTKAILPGSVRFLNIIGIPLIIIIVGLFICYRRQRESVVPAASSANN
jgi:ABC-2 type transport system permease protein